MKPLRIFIFLASVALLLLLIALTMPPQGIRFTAGIHLKFMDPSELFPKDAPEAERERDVESLIAASSVTEDPESDFTGDRQEPEIQPGKLQDADRTPVPAADPANSDSLKHTICRIELPEDGSVLMDPFFQKLEALLDGTRPRARILHFGDSQIENDRMTALIRYRLQKQFGGTGTGLVQAIPLYSGNMAYRQDQEGEWLRYTFFGKRDSAIRHNAYGVMGAFTSVPMPRGEEWPYLHYEFNTRRRTGTVNRVRVFLHSYVKDACVAVMVNDTISDTIRHIPDGFSVVDYTHHCPVKDVRLFMDLPEGGRIYGISFESYYGIQVDNIAMRGGSGLIFSRMNREHQLRMMEYLSPDLLILQFGGNVVPYIDPEFYRRAFTRELRFLKDLCPGVPVIVIGPSDMSLKEKGRFVTYPGIEPVRDALRSAALENGFAFWDLYEAMGGNNSMPSFVHAVPPLASTDYVHFTALGVNLVAEMFYNALMLEFRQYTSKPAEP
jgi:lysophospholipase L1-like esterase